MKKVRAAVYNTVIESVEDMGIQDTRHFRLRFSPGDSFDFDAGQFVNLMIPTEEKTLKRPYSIASPPDWKDIIDICWRKVPGGTVTEKLWHCREGDSLTIQGPLGRFVVRRPLPHRIVFVSTGTGIAPFRAMIHQLLVSGESCSILNIFGTRYEEDILYREEFEDLARKYPHFQNIFTVSRPKNWKGETDYVQHVFKKHIKNPHHTHVYICGLSNMILDVENTALNIGFHKEQIFYEKYD